MSTELTNEQVFKLLCMEVIESLGFAHFAPTILLYEMTNPGFIDWCEKMVFIDDDGKLDEGEKFLLDWMKQNLGNLDLIRQLMPVAERLEMKIKS
ncbi:hypothetical protein [Limnofasciculus baicalensis]|uniref:SxtC n=1 Tax=Limnofasciculus baicalensis BBK-W-15 TaxID=2699891 RepID=A0AAE3GPB9_9CYAN|nr:hypothetical protein [Limnofasciculus baicalensis]MCP2728261.1 hypothetical protein [Limnofasciculus baicalensis BBK-W-15]